MTCRELVGFLDDYLEGVLPDGTRMTFDEHLAVCPNCVAYLNTYRRSVALAGSAFDPPPADVPDELLRAILAARPAAEDSRKAP